jgi:hypothetical protein
MPNDRNSVEATITVRNQASGPLNQVFSDLQRSRVGLQELAQTLQGLNPAFSSLVYTINDFSRATKGFDVATKVTAVGIGLVTAGFVAYTQALKASVDAQVRFNQIINSADVGRIRGELSGINTELERMALLGGKIGGGSSSNPLIGGAAGWAARFGLVGQLIPEVLGFQKPAEQRQAEALAALRPLLAVEGQGQRAEVNSQVVAQILQQLAARQQQAAGFSDITRYRALASQIEAEATQQEGLALTAFDKATGLQRGQLIAGGQPIDEFNQTQARRRALIQEGFRTGRLQRQLASQGFQQDILERLYLGQGAEQFQPGQGAEQVSAGEAASTPFDMSRARIALDNLVRSIIVDIIEQPTRENAAAFEGGAEAVGVGPTPAETRAGAIARQARDVEQLDTAKQLFDVRKAYVGLSKDEQDALEKVSIEMQRQLDIAQVGGNEAQKDLANARADMAQINLELTKLERTDALAGLAKGFKDVAEDAQATGRIMQDFARATANSMQRSFSDLFFNVMTGNFKNLGDIGKQFALGLARDLSDSLSKQVTGSIFGGISALFPQNGGQPFPFGNAASGDFSPAQLVALQNAGFKLVQGASGGTVIVAPTQNQSSLSTLINSVAGGFSSLKSLFSSEPEAGAPGGGFGIGPGEGEGGLDSGLGGLAGGGGGGAGVGALFGLVGLAIGSSGDKHDQRVGQGIAVGAGIGGQVGGVYGAAIGAILGLAVGVATQDVKDEEDLIKSGVRRGDAADIKRLTPLLDADIARVNAATDFAGLADGIRLAMHGAYGGPQDRGAGRHGGRAGFAVFIDGNQVILPGGKYPATMTLDDFAGALRDKGETFSAALQMGLSVSNLRQINDAYTQAVRDKVDQIRGFAATPISYDDVGPGLTRTTILAAGALANTPGAAGHQLYIDRSYLQKLGWTESQMDAFIRSIADRNTQTDRFPDLPRDVRLIL